MRWNLRFLIIIIIHSGDTAYFSLGRCRNLLSFITCCGILLGALFRFCSWKHFVVLALFYGRFIWTKWYKILAIHFVLRSYWAFQGLIAFNLIKNVFLSFSGLCYALLSAASQWRCTFVDFLHFYYQCTSDILILLSFRRLNGLPVAVFFASSEKNFIIFFSFLRMPCDRAHSYKVKAKKKWQKNGTRE